MSRSFFDQRVGQGRLWSLEVLFEIFEDEGMEGGYFLFPIVKGHNMSLSGGEAETMIRGPGRNFVKRFLEESVSSIRVW